jgi:hypothetical protein
LAGWSPIRPANGPGQVLEVPVEEGEEGAAEALLRFMYTGGLEPAVAGAVGELLKLLRLADRFQVGAAAGRRISF